MGTTSACAENTLKGTSGETAIGNYLRVRGEYLRTHRDPTNDWELPPRARRILSAWGFPALPQGTTSACAENTFGANTV